MVYRRKRRKNTSAEKSRENSAIVTAPAWRLGAPQPFSLSPGCLAVRASAGTSQAAHCIVVSEVRPTCDRALASQGWPAKPRPGRAMPKVARHHLRQVPSVAAVPRPAWLQGGGETDSISPCRSGQVTAQKSIQDDRYRVASFRKRHRPQRGGGWGQSGAGFPTGGYKQGF